MQSLNCFSLPRLSKPPFSSSPLLLATSLLLVVGCSSDTPAPTSVDSTTTGRAGEPFPTAAKESPSASQPATPADSQPKIPRLDPKTLPPTENYSPAVDGGRLQIPLLVDWVIPPRNPQWLFRLQRDKKVAYPQIFITVNEDLAPELQELAQAGVTKANVTQFVTLWRRHLEKSHDEKSFAEPVTALRVGNHYAASCLIYAASEKTKQDQLLMTVIIQGRVYTLELRTLRGTLEDYRTSLYAVVAGLKESTPAETLGEFPTLGKTPPDETPTAEPQP